MRQTVWLDKRGRYILYGGSLFHNSIKLRDIDIICCTIISVFLSNIDELKWDPANVISRSSSEHAPFYNKDHCRIFDASHSHGYTRYTVLAPTRLLISHLVRLHQRVRKSIHIHTSCHCYYYQFAVRCTFQRIFAEQFRYRSDEFCM